MSTTNLTFSNASRFTLKMLKRHQRSKNEQFPCMTKRLNYYECTTCNRFHTHFKVTLRKHILSNHLVKRVKSKGFTCRKCPFNTFSRYLYLRHNLHGKCGENPKNKATCLENPEIKNRRLKRCCMCPFRTKYKYNLISHYLKTHAPKKNVNALMCAHCSFRAKRLSRIKEHIKVKHPTKHSQLKYGQCDHNTCKRYTVYRRINRIPGGSGRNGRHCQIILNSKKECKVILERLDLSKEKLKYDNAAGAIVRLVDIAKFPYKKPNHYTLNTRVCKVILERIDLTKVQLKRSDVKVTPVVLLEAMKFPNNRLMFESVESRAKDCKVVLEHIDFSKARLKGYS